MADGKTYFFFGAVDRKGHKEDGEIASEYPAYMMRREMQELEEEIEQTEGKLKRNEVKYEDRPYEENQLHVLKERRNMIVSSRPKIEGADKDYLYKEILKIEDEIKESMPTLSQMEMGSADAHVEADRMISPCIKVNTALAQQLGIRNISHDGKVSRDDAIKMCRIMGDNVDPGNYDGNMERLRRDKLTARGRG